MPSLDSQHTFTLTIDGTGYWDTVLPGTVRFIDAEGSQVDTLTFDLDDPATSISITNWDEVVWIADGSTYIFGGYVTGIKASPNASTLGRVLTIDCEGYITRCYRTEIIAKTYVDTTPGAIVDDLFSEAGITGFDTTTHVTAGTAGDPFVVDFEPLGKALDRLALREGWVWRVDAQKNVWFGPSSSDQAAFDVSDEGNANYTTIFPVMAADYSLSADEIKNKVIVHAGFTGSALQTDQFNGDGSTKLFNLSQTRISQIQEISVGGVLQRYGLDGWHGSSSAGTIDSGYTVLVNYRAGYVWFYSAPGSGTNNVVVKYHYNTPLTWSKTDAASVTKFGLTFVEHIYDTSLAAQGEAEAVIDAILADYADEVVQGSFTVRRLGLRAAQEIDVQIDGLGVNGSYTLRSVEYGTFAAGYIECRATYGGRSLRLSQILRAQTVQPYEEPGLGTVDINNGKVWNQFQIGSGVADFGGIT